MDKSTKGILLHRIEHSENSAILKVLTPEEGLASFIWKGAKKKRKGGSFGSIAIPLNRLELTARFKDADELHLLKEVKVANPFQKVLSEPERSSIALFLSEFLYRISSFQGPDPEYFEELEAFVDALDRIEDPRDLHLHLIARSMLHQGIAPEGNPEGSRNFDLLEGSFRKGIPEHTHYLDREESRILQHMLETGPGDEERFLKGRTNRQELLGKLIEHHRLHLGEFGPIRSLQVLREIYSDPS